MSVAKPRSLEHHVSTPTSAPSISRKTQEYGTSKCRHHPQHQTSVAKTQKLGASKCRHHPQYQMSVAKTQKLGTSKCRHQSHHQKSVTEPRKLDIRCRHQHQHKESFNKAMIAWKCRHHKKKCRHLQSVDT